MANQISRDIYVLSNKIKDPIDYVRLTNDIPIVFTFRDYDIPSGATAYVYVQKPSGKAVYDNAAISGNVVTVTVTDQMFAELGICDLQIRISQNSEKLVSFSQPVKVHPNYTEGDAEQSKNGGGFFDDAAQAVESANQAAQSANQAASSANSIAEEIEQKAENGDFSASVSIGTVTTGQPGSDASVTNTGTEKDAVFNFSIPQGSQGPQGPQGPPGEIENIGDATVDFTQSNTRQNIVSGEAVSTIFGKIAKWFSDLGTAAFQGVSNVLTQTSSGYVLDARQGKALDEKKINKAAIVNNLLATIAGFPLDATQGKILADMIGILASLTTDEKSNLVSAINEINAGLSELNGKSYTLTEGTLGLATRAYCLKRYNDGTFELDGRADASLVRLQYSESTKMYFTSITIPLPNELNISDDRYVFTAGTESAGIYFVSLQSISGNTMTIYLSAMNYVSEIPLVEIGFRLTGHWE